MKHPIYRSSSQFIIEALESRIAPASLLTYTDVDGDIVKVTSSKGDLSAAGVATFSAHGVGEQLDQLNLTNDSFFGSNIVFHVHKGAQGDGQANVGFINAAGNDLGKVIVQGDLGHLVAGDGNNSGSAVKLLKAHSLGAYFNQSSSGSGTNTGDTGSGLDVSTVLETVHTLVGSGTDLIGKILAAAGNATSGSGLSTNGQHVLATLGSDLGVLLSGVASGKLPVDQATQILSNVLTDANSLLNLSSSDQNSMGSALVTTATNLAVQVGNLLGVTVQTTTGSGSSTSSAGSTPTAHHSLLGLPGLPVITLPILGITIGGGGTTTGGTTTGGTTTGGTTTGGATTGTGSGTGSGTLDLGSLLGGVVESTVGTLGSLLTGTGVLGSTASSLPTTVSSLLTSTSQGIRDILGAVPTDLLGLPTVLKTSLAQVGSDLTGVLNGSEPLTGAIANELALLQSDLASVLGSANHLVGLLPDTVKTTLDSLSTSVKNLLTTNTNGGNSGTGGTGTTTPAPDMSFDISGTLARLVVAGDVSNVFLNVTGNIGSAKIGGSLVGGGDANSAEISAGGNVNSLKIGGNVIGGGDTNSGSIQVDGYLKHLHIGGSVLGGNGTNSASIVVGSEIGTISISHDITGRDGAFSGSILDSNGGIKHLTVGGSIVGGVNANMSSISVTNTIGSLIVKGSVLGYDGERMTVSALGAKVVSKAKDLAIGVVKIGGSVQDTDFLAGADHQSNVVNGAAQVGNFYVGHDWTASSLSAGVSAGGDDSYGNSGDAVANDTGHPGIWSRIASITIRGSILGTQDSSDHYGFVAASIGKFVEGHTVLPLNPGAVDSVQLCPTTQDVTVQEVQPTATQVAQG